MNIKIISLSLLTGCIACAVVACSNTSSKDNAHKQEVPITNQTIPTAEATDQVNTSFLDENNQVIALSDLKGKVVFINFWATWCPPCIREMPSIDQLKKRYKNNPNIVFLLVDVDSSLDKSQKFMRDNKLDLPVHIPNGKIPSEFLGRSIPTTVILDKEGLLAARVEGARDYMAPEMIKALDKLVDSLY